MERRLRRPVYRSPVPVNFLEAIQTTSKLVPDCKKVFCTDYQQRIDTY